MKNDELVGTMKAGETKTLKIYRGGTAIVKFTPETSKGYTCSVNNGSLSMRIEAENGEYINSYTISSLASSNYNVSLYGGQTYYLILTNSSSSSYTDFLFSISN